MATKKFSGILNRNQEVNRNAASSSRVINNGSTIAAVDDDGTLTVIAEQKEVEVIIDQDGHYQEVEREVTPKADPRDIIRQAARRRAAARTTKEADQMRQAAQDVTPQPAAPAPEPKQDPTTPKQEPAAPAPKKATERKATAKQQTAAPKATASPKAAATKEAPAKPRYTLMQYSEKCVALFGDTKPIKDELRRIGGRYNPSLHPFGQETNVPGWVFPNKYRDDVEQLINRKS